MKDIKKDQERKLIVSCYDIETHSEHNIMYTIRIQPLERKEIDGVWSLSDWVRETTPSMVRVVINSLIPDILLLFQYKGNGHKWSHIIMHQGDFYATYDCVMFCHNIIENQDLLIHTKTPFNCIIKNLGGYTGDGKIRCNACL